MKKILFSIICAAIVLPVFVSAQEASSTSNTLNQFRKDKIEDRAERREDRAAERMVKFDELKTKFENKSTEFKTRLEERRSMFAQKLEERKTKTNDKRAKLEAKSKERVEKFLGNIYERCQNALEKLNNVADRLEQKITDLKANGKDTANVESLLATAKTKIADAVTELEAGKNALNTAVSEDVSKEDIRTVVGDVKNSIKAAHAALVDVIVKIKGLGSADDKNATTTE